MEVRVPDIGDFSDVPVIEVLVSPGDTVAPEDPLITLESDKATMDVPAPAGGVVQELKVSVGDKVSEGAVILVLETEEAEAAAPAAESDGGRPAAAPAEPKAPEPAARGDVHGQVVVVGSGPGGYTAAFRAADLGLETVLIERYPSLGGVCLNVGCIPSKALLHAARVLAEADEAAEFGVRFGDPQIDLDALRGWKDKVVGQLTGGLGGLAKRRKVRVVQGRARFTGPNTLAVEEIGRAHV